MRSINVKFDSQSGESLAAVLELPIDRHPHTFAIFAHCFTCNKDYTAIWNISKAMTRSGIAVLRFDFTGLGESDGEFADTTLSSNVDDLVSAAEYLESNYSPVEILIGHSLGGAAVLAAGGRIESVRAVVTIAAPSSPDHLAGIIGDRMKGDDRPDRAMVRIGGRDITIGKRFLDDLDMIGSEKTIAGLGKALLVMHSPQDRTVGVDHAAKIYKSAKHPKSFISLHGADHLLSDKRDSTYTGEMIASWASRYIEKPKTTDLSTDQEVVVRTGATGYTTDILAAGHRLTADEPESVGGNNFGPNPYDLLLSGLGACTGMTLRMYADRKKWNLNEVRVHLKHRKIHASDCEECETASGKIDQIERIIELEGDLDTDQRQRLLEIADRCPVHRTLHSEIKIKSSLR